jgi:hypothetical protein
VTGAERGLTTRLIHRETEGPVPAGTTHVEVEVRFRAATGPGSGYADNITLVLR